MRDVMARKTKPVVSIDFRFPRVKRYGGHQRHAIEPTVSNVGQVTLENWWLVAELPKDALANPTQVQVLDEKTMQVRRKMLKSKNTQPGANLIEIGYGDPFIDGSRFILHPGQSQTFSAVLAPGIEIEITDELFDQWSKTSPPLQWTLFLKDNQPQTGTVPFEVWCDY